MPIIHDSSYRETCGHIAYRVRRQRMNRNMVRTIEPPSSPPVNNPLPPVKLHLLKVPQHSQTILPAGNQVFKDIAYGGMFCIQPTTSTKGQTDIWVLPIDLDDSDM